MNVKKYTTRMQTLAKYAVVLLVVGAISMLFPDNVRFKYQFERNKTWRYDDLVAPFDFPIQKSEEELRLDRTVQAAGFSPYYAMDDEVSARQQAMFELAFRQQLSDVQGMEQFEEVLTQSERYIDYGKNLLRDLFERGILRLSDEHPDAGDGFVVNIVHGSTTQKQTVGNLLNVRAARDLLDNPLAYGDLKDADVLLPILQAAIVPNITYSADLTTRFRDEQLNGIPTGKGLVSKGDLIVTQGGIITDAIHEKLRSFQDKYEKEVTKKRSTWGIFLGYFLLTSLIVGVFLLYIQRYAKEHFQHLNRLVFVFMWLVIYSYLVYIVESTHVLSTYVIPFCIVPIVIKHFYDSRMALFTHIIVVLIASFLSSLGYEFTFMQIIAGIVAVLGNVDSRDLSQFFYSIGFIFLAYVLTFFGLSLVQEANLETVDWQVCIWLFLNVFLILLAYPFVPLLERLFGFTSTSSLIELSDMNRPLLKDLATKAPGTLQHSLQVANLSEAAARAIDADPLLIRVAALYHDIGKTVKPTCYIENQNHDNPHDNFSALESAKTIIEHVTAGVALAKKARLPKPIIRFIETHHGTTRVEYFYRKFIADNPGQEFDESLFRYPGPRPSTKEETILMITDSIEAACKSLQKPTGFDIDTMVDKVVQGKIKNGQLEESALSFQELEQCLQIFKQLLRSIHHVRVEYPEDKTEA